MLKLFTTIVTWKTVFCRLYNLNLDLKLVRRHLLIPLYCLVSFPPPSYSVPSNDAVSVSFPYSFLNPTDVEMDNTVEKRGLLSFLRIIGSGGGGTVFSGYLTPPLDITLAHTQSNAVMKVSNPLSSKSVENECSILRYLSDKTTQSNYFKKRPLNIETCIASCQLKNIRIIPSLTYPQAIESKNAIQDTLTRMMSTNNDRRVIFLRPFFETKTLSFKPASSSMEVKYDIMPLELAKVVAKDLFHTALSMIALKVTNSDVQTLIDPNTGNSLLIDLTEAVLLTDNDSFNQQRIRSFLDELLSLLSSTIHTNLSSKEWEALLEDTLREEIRDIQHNYEGYKSVPANIQELLEDF
mmetsp:Transcript_25658/g.36800  ORF Transcript_25658/g.36800 Transcript_25658/m.36800 type:complete len:352 (-) Transcript_25658:152-1207(-)